MDQSPTTRSPALTHKYRIPERKQLEIDIRRILVISAVATVGVYILALPFWNVYLGKLFFQRGWTQPIVVFMTAFVVTFIVLRHRQLKGEFKALRGSELPRNLSLKTPSEPTIIELQRSLSSKPHLVANRCIRTLNAYVVTGNRESVSNFAADDAISSSAASESSYIIPRVLVWAIPLLGFVGTVLGISSAVDGFSQFLQGAEEVQKIKEGIGTVTTGLALAFDTTLLALILSIAVMIPLVIVERMELRLLQGIESYINDGIISRIEESPGNLDEETIRQSVEKVMEKRLPSPEALIEPAKVYATEAASVLAQQFLAEVSPVKEIASSVITQIEQLAQLLANDRQQFLTVSEQQRQQTLDMLKGLTTEINSANHQLIDQVQANHTDLSMGLATQTEKLSQTLSKATDALEERISAMERYSKQTNEVAQLQQTLNNTLSSLEKTQDLQLILTFGI